MSYKIITDKYKIGPGVWTSLNILAFHSRTKEEQIIFCKSVRIICSNFPCTTCRNHSMEYIKNSPPEAVIDEKNEKAMFKWLCDFHNYVNRTKENPSPIVNWELIYKEYEKNAPNQKANEEEFESVKIKTPIQKANEEIYNRVMSRNIKK